MNAGVQVQYLIMGAFSSILLILNFIIRFFFEGSDPNMIPIPYVGQFEPHNIRLFSVCSMRSNTP